MKQLYSCAVIHTSVRNRPKSKPSFGDLHLPSRAASYPVIVNAPVTIVKSSQVTFIYIAPLTIQIVTKHCTMLYRNLGSLRAGKRHHGEFLRYGNSFPPTFPEDLLPHASPNDWPIVAKHANTSSRGSINAAPATITSESDTERRLAERAAITAITVMSRSCSQGTEVTIVTGAFPFELSRDITENFSVMGTLFNPAEREATGSLYQIHSEVEFPSIMALVGRAHSWWVEISQWVPTPQVY